MYLPDEILGAKVLITVKTYPQPSSKYDELVCTAGFFEGKWMRLYPVPFRALPYKDQYSKYHWVELDLIRNYSDFRIESYKPKYGIDGIVVGEKVDTKKNWLMRKDYVLKEVFTSMDTLIRLAHNEKRSLGVLKPSQVVKFVIEQQEREWKKEWQDQLLQYNLFNLDEKGEGKKRSVIRKLPYKYSYEFLSEGDKKPRKLMIEDWEIGALYWNCLEKCEGDEDEANRLVKEKYFDYFCSQRDLYFFMGTTKAHHYSPSPFIIIGVFWPPRLAAEQLSLFDFSQFDNEW
jgi:hypothetical protein